MAGTGTSRTLVEDFLYREADCLDRWALEEWLALWADTGEISYVVAPTGEPDVAELEPSTAMFLIADDRYRLQQRVIRMGKKTFHSEYRPSRTRHMYSNVRLLRQTDETVDVAFNSAVYRTRKEKTIVYPALVRATLRLNNGAPSLQKKRMELDLEHLATMGALTILL